MKDNAFQIMARLSCQIMATSQLINKETMIDFLKNHVFFYIGYLTALSVVAFFAYAIDKEKAKRGAWRIPEKVLLTLSLIGGATGGYLAMNLVRHKTRKWYFHAVNVIGLAWQLGLLAFLLTA